MSFPYLSDLVKAVTGYDVPLPLPMFGICVALAMVIAAACLRRELGLAGSAILVLRARIKTATA